MRVNLAHLRDQDINFAVFDADAISHLDQDRSTLLAQLTACAQASGLRVEKAALAFVQGGRPTYYGTTDLVRYLSSRGVPRWTHTIDV